MFLSLLSNCVLQAPFAALFGGRKIHEKPRFMGIKSIPSLYAALIRRTSEMSKNPQLFHSQSAAIQPQRPSSHAVCRTFLAQIQLVLQPLHTVQPRQSIHGALWALPLYSTCLFCSNDSGHCAWQSALPRVTLFLPQPAFVVAKTPARQRFFFRRRREDPFL